MSFLVTAQSPRYYTLFADGDTNNDGNTITDRVGLLARNTYRDDKLASLDVRFSRLFTLMERLRLEAIAEAFNLTNTLNVTDLNSVYGSPYLIGPLPTHFGDHAPAASPVFGGIQAISAPRQLQFALKLTF